jgi:serine/threonine protein kinase
MQSPPRLVDPLPLELDQFTLLERLATGGMADVYLALERRPLGAPRWMAIKRVRADLAARPEFVEFFLTEGRVSLACRHPNLPTAHQLGVASHRPYLALEYVPGPTLLAVQRAVVQRRRALSLPSVLAVAMALARALEHLHTLTDVDGRALDVIHRDVTPQNLLIGPGGVVKLIDLGVARAAVQTHRTQVGVIKGKYAYIAPEQLDRDRVVDQRSDLFSWGTVVHEMLTARPLFHGTSELDTCDRIRTGPIANPATLRPEVPAAFAQVVLTALARDPDRRFGSASALVAALEHATEQGGMWPWPSHLAREVIGLCGAPRTPHLRGDVIQWKSATPPPARPPATDDLDDAVTPVVQVRGEGGSWEREPDAVADPLLSYFLKAGAVEPWQGSEASDISQG